MDATLGCSLRYLDVLFEEDFDAEAVVPAADLPPEPQIIEPHFSAAEIAAARGAAWGEGRQAGVAEANAGHIAALTRAMTSVASVLADSASELALHAERTADGLARTLMGSLAAMLPALCRAHGETEMRAVLQTILPGLIREPAVTIRVHPRLCDAARTELCRLDPLRAANVSVVPTDAITYGDVRVDWEDGVARRDTRLIWRDIRGVLMDNGLLNVAEAEWEMVDAG